MKHLSKYMIIPILLLVLIPLFTGGCVFKTTGGTEVGIRTNKIGIIGKKGVEDKVYPPGSTFFILPYINDWHTLDIKRQNLEMVFDPKAGDRKTRDDLLFKTIDGNDISLDVTIKYKVNPEKAPYIIQHVAQSDTGLREKIVRTIARSKPRDIFGELTSEEFYVADKREQQALKAQETLQNILGPMGIIVEEVLTKNYRFNEEYQKAIEDKKVADQLAQKYKSAQKATEEEYKRKLEEAKGEVNQMVALADGEYLKAKIEADVYYEQQKLIAEAIKTEGITQAKGIQEMNKALTGSGGEALVKLKIAEAIQGKKIMLIPVSEGGMNLKTTDINQLIHTMGIKSMAPEKIPPKQEAK